MSRPSLARLALLALLALLAVPAALAPAARAAPGGWARVDYGALVDRRELTHSGEAVGTLLDALGGRPHPGPGGDPADLQRHRLLDPFLERYAVAIPGVLDALAPDAADRWFEIAGLWLPGDPQPAWVELARARRIVVETNGAGGLRVALPVELEATAGDPERAARAAWEAWWPVLRHAVAAEALRLGGDGGPRPIDVEARAYHALPARTELLLGMTPHRARVTDTRSDGARPPLDLDAWAAFLADGLQIEGARLDDEGGIVLLGSRPETPPTLLGRPIDLSDLAVAYRAVFHGGQAEPYMSLDRSMSPQRAVVNYGGRLRDTALGWVSLLCDIRFKTFSLGLDVITGEDRRAEIRRALPSFRSHLERFSADPGSRDVAGQQTRLWFYPDAVDLTVSGEGDVVVLRKVRMSAASERVAAGTLAAEEGDDPPWTRQTVAAIDRDYDALARFFPEMRDLDQVVRLLSLFTWARSLERDGRRLPDLDALLAVELPALPTPRTFPQLLAFNALPADGGGGPDAVETFGRVAVAEALDRLDPLGPRPLDARRRLDRALATLDARNPQNATLLEEFSGYTLDALDDPALDLLAFRAERNRMHQTVLSTLPLETRRGLAARQEAGDALRVFSVAIGGLDLDMGAAVERARGATLRLSGFGADARATEGARASAVAPHRATGDDAPREDWRAASPAFPSTAGTAPPPAVREAAGRGARTADGDVQRHTLERNGDRWTARPVAVSATGLADLDGAPAYALPAGVALLRVGLPADGARVGPTGALRLRLDGLVGGAAQTLETDFPRSLLQRLTLGAEVDPAPGRPLPGLAPLPPNLGTVETLLLAGPPGRFDPSGTPGRPLLAGEEDPVRLARALRRWWDATGTQEGTAAAVAFDPARAVDRLAAAPRPARAELRVARALADPADPALADRLRAAWPPAGELESGGGAPAADVLVVVGAIRPERWRAELRARGRGGALRGKLLALVPLAGALDAGDLAALADELGLAGIGVADTGLVGRRALPDELAAFRAAVAANGERGRPVQALPGPFLWMF